MEHYEVLSIDQQFNLAYNTCRGYLRGEVAKVLDSDLEVSDFEF